MKASEARKTIKRVSQTIAYFRVPLVFNFKKGDISSTFADEAAEEMAKSEFEAAAKDVDTICDLILDEKEAALLRYLWEPRNSAKHIQNIIEMSGCDLIPIDFETDTEGNTTFIYTPLAAIFHACKKIVTRIEDAALDIGTDLPPYKPTCEARLEHGQEKVMHESGQKDLHYYCEEAVKLGYLSKVGNGYKRERIIKSQLAYFLGHFLNEKGQFPDKEYCIMFNETRLSKALSQLIDNKNGKPRGYEKIDALLSM